MWCILFWLAAGFLFYMIFGYPLLMAAWARWRPAPPVEKRFEPKPVAVVLPVQNGAAFLARKLESLLALDYPRRYLEIWVISDGSTDDTDRIAAGFAGQGVRLLRVPKGGKPAALNAGVAASEGEILFFTDVRQPLDPGSLRALVANFADDSVGAVCGELIIEKDQGLYWRYEKWIRRQLSRAGSLMVVTGCIFGMRRSLFVPVPADSLVDDALLPIQVLLEGKRVVFEPAARAYEVDRPAMDVLRRNAGEVGMHLHAWDSPPPFDLTGNDCLHRPYLIEYPLEIMHAKIAALTSLLQDTFEVKMTSHRAGRWAFNGTYARALIANGYFVDCSVTPRYSWKSNLGAPQGLGGTDYTAAPSAPYFLDLEDICRPGGSSLLEAPVSVMPVSPRWVDTLRGSFGARAVPRRILNRLWPPLTWLRPDGRNRRLMLRLVRKALEERRAHVEFILHSSEFMPGGSPAFPDADSIAALYRDLRALFAAARDTCAPLTLTEFALRYVPRSSSHAGWP